MNNYQQQPSFYSNQTSAQPPYIPPPPPAPQSRLKRVWRRYRSMRKLAQWGIGCLVIFLLCGMCSFAAALAAPGTQQITSSTATPTLALSGNTVQVTPTTAPQARPTTVPTAKPTPKPTPKPQPPSLDQQINTIVQGAGLHGSNIKSMYNVGGDNYEKITEDLGDGNITNDLTVGEIKIDCFTVEKALWTQMAAHLSEVEMNITMNVIDQYGNKSNESVADCDLKSDTAHKFNWDNLTFDMAWGDYDSTFIAPFLTQ